MALLYLFFSYVVSHYNMHYFFEFTKELKLKLLMIFVMYGFAFFIYKTMDYAINSGNRLVLVFFFFSFYIVFDLVSELAIITSSYRKSIEPEKYLQKMTQILKIDEETAKDDFMNFKKNNNKKPSVFSKIYSKYLGVTVYDCFIDHENNCYGVHDKAFFLKLMEFSKENQRFFGKRVTEHDCILDCRCNVVCISSDEFSFIDCNGSKCIFTRKINKIYL